MDTKCWTCTKPGKSLCAWDASKATVPVEGWTAIPTTVRIDERVEPSYLVLECPLYEKDTTAAEREYKRGAPTSLSDRDLIQWVLNGLTDYEIARRVGLKSKTVAMRRRKLEKEGIL